MIKNPKVTGVTGFTNSFLKGNEKESNNYIYMSPVSPTPEQLDFINSKAVVAAALASPGCAKTSTVIMTAQHFVSKGASPGRILVLTFTNNAVTEIQERLNRYGTNGVRVCTIHSFCKELYTSYNPGFSLLDEVDQLKAFRTLLPETSAEITKKLITAFQRNRNLQLKDEDLNKAFFELSGSVISQAVKSYQDYKNENRLYDFEDMISGVLDLFESRKDILNRVREHFECVVLDEAQDTSLLQWNLILAISKKLRVVGDPKQSIYGWRGGVTDFVKLLPGAELFALTRNFRSTPQIINILNSVYPTKIETVKEAGLRPSLLNFDNEELEAVEIAKQAMEAQSNGHKVAILSRDRKHLKNIALFLMAIGGDLRQFELSKDLTNFLKGWRYLCSGSPFELSELHVGLGIEQSVVLDSGLADGILIINDEYENKLNFLKHLQFSSGLKDKYSLLNFYQLIWCKFFGQSESLLKATVTLSSGKLELVKKFTSRLPITVNTIHSQKGAEYDTVFLVSCVDGVMPSAQSKDLVEEKNGFYVAISRPRYHLTISYFRKNINGRPTQPSPFLSELHRGGLVSYVRQDFEKISADEGADLI